MKLEEHLKKYFNYTTFRTGQKEVISSILEGNHTIAMLPTGTGKSLCYQLSGYLLKGQVIIISPLLSLMQDQTEQLMMNGEKRVIAFNSFLTPQERKQALSQLNTYKFIFLSPEMLKSDFILNRLRELQIALFVIDEAHCISQWGYDFRPDYLKLGDFRRKLGNPLTLALTATATPEVKEELISSLSLKNWNEYIYSVDRPNIVLAVEVIDSYHDKSDRLVELVQNLEGPGIVYFSSKKMAEKMTIHLKQNGIDRVMAYHGGMEQENRVLIQQQFLHDQLDVICATSAFGMGINKENIRYVIHFHMPLQLESYLQEIGRAGRDGMKSIALLLYSPGDEQLPFQLAEGELPSEAQLDFVYHLLEEKNNSINDLGELENELISLSGLTEVQWRVVADYLFGNTKEPMQQRYVQLKVFINERLQVKRKKINDMLIWTQAQLNGCRRKNILKYFKEDKTIEIDDCCDQCGIDLTVFYPKTKNHKTADNFFDWKKHLAKILLVSERG
ncbi:RecQ family ATP-dependent DNA helicase [Cytobacillus solani]|uniref:ATP-dependent DNA helicase n=1 Tax=Cytobacillus solani TaxID=1637975 RepID=A0A0Q3VIP8_9BACI|nr:ATP-dependent DNA helicase RecQ [Cytobacillus solani]KQL20307.1 ATP-dependent DNA helicase [Cytobacillus solani]USK53563.1 RecQ family ATP-dependent DNA helicase [Cytobacillus solani]